MSEKPENLTPEGYSTNPNIWNKPPVVNPQILHPKKKHKWGMTEVLISILILLCTQVAIAVGVMLYVTMNMVGSGVQDVEITLKAVNDAIRTPLILLASAASMYFSWGIMMWYSTKYRGHKSWAKDFWLKFKLPKDIFIGLGVAALGFGIVQGLSALLIAFGVNMNEAGNTSTFSGLTGFWKFFFFIGVVSIIGPIFEELFFRGFLMQSLIRNFRRGNISAPRGSVSNYTFVYAPMVFNAYKAMRNFSYKHKYALSAIISSLFFGMMHFQGTSLGQLMTVLITGTLGFLFALTTIRTRRLAPAIFAHIFYNGSVAIITLMSIS